MVCWSRKLCVVVVRSRSGLVRCPTKKLCLPHHFGPILTIFAKFNYYYFDFDRAAITLKPSRNEEFGHFPILIKKYRLLWCEEFQSSWRSFYAFSVQKCDLLLFYLMKKGTQHLITYHKLTELVLVDFFIKVTNICHFWSCSISYSFVWNVIPIKKAAYYFFILILTLKKNDIRLYSYTILSHKIIPHLLNALELENRWFYYSRKLYHILLVVKKMILCLYWNHQHICKECSQTQNAHLFYRKLLPMCYSSYN